MILVSKLSHIYPGGRTQKPRTAIHELDLEVKAGEFCILSGPNGSGKSTLFRILCGLLRPSAGSIRIKGIDLATEPARARAALGVVFQSPALDKHLMVGENLELHAALHGLRGKDYRDRLDEALAWSDLSSRLKDRVETLSGGLARQVELVKCMLTHPEILLLDEPTTGLDPNSRRAFLTALKGLKNAKSMTVLMTSHVFSEAEDADRVAIMKDGKLLAFDSPNALRARLGHEVIVIESQDSSALAQALASDPNMPPLRLYGSEIRIEDVSGARTLALTERLLTQHRAQITSLAIKQPGLEDVFVHVTGHSAPPMGTEAAP